jgi:hypothetical protein
MNEERNHHLELARRVIEEQTHPIWCVAALRQETGLGLPEAKALIVMALNERDGTYYLAAPSAETVHGPFVGVATAEGECRQLDGYQVILVSGESEGPHSAAERFLRAFPDPADRPLVDQLLRLLGDAQPKLRDVLSKRWDRMQLIELVEQRLNVTS